VIECLKQHGYVENKTLFAEPCECLPPSCCVSGDFLAPPFVGLIERTA
jgi:hypothetical protein